MLALDSGHTIGNIARPNLIGLLHIELPIQKVRGIQVRLIRFLVSVTWRLRAHQSQLLHPSAGTVTCSAAFRPA